MSNTHQSVNNLTSEQQYQGTLEKVLFSTLTTMPCCVFLFINGTMLFTLRSKAVFCDTSRYVLLFNLLFADTAQMALSQVLYIIAACGITLTYPVCGTLNFLASLTTVISPLTLVLMSLERYVAVCFPLRHTSIITIRNTAVVVAVVWAFSSLNILTRVFLLLKFPFEGMPSLQMNVFCSEMAMVLDYVSDQYVKAFTCFVFVSAGLVVISTYVSVMMAARSASADKALARKARNTLLLHVVQLGLTLSSTIYSPLLIALSRILTRIVFVRIQNVLYVCVFIFPRCLSSLIYGLRDQSIKPVLIYHLCCRMKLLPVRTDPTVG
ncbi:odorant receptor 131-2-like [Melanotaenia boesemani]|uniref:odorant receptor 131-2-like n=1 Tax=Melanotaenia boesemani TaxID=1250792 RepID=UPI001C03EB1D|nr:odorant receptor 131-2-like [Melanotaenia boesemani]